MDTDNYGNFGMQSNFDPYSPPKPKNQTIPMPNPQMQPGGYTPQNNFGGGEQYGGGFGSGNNGGGGPIYGNPGNITGTIPASADPRMEYLNKMAKQKAF